ncbi:hypothetical protein [Amaricoccus solimangrovi]|uniref:Uncharacterized protein n=1 Tax=Amaricoccus solimangrovi TaxID=2589815 RepID=A0A501WB96_9RHOB|nr:hypothetical protein [Amaricoccus solimangrovi]TPE46889.1 hypothetical protein FJM51_21090 [Amaricoccus solimangrovi]
MADTKDERPQTDAGPHREQAQPGQDLEHDTAPGENVRPAGTKEMDLPVRNWSKTDEESDESFPASDPPGNY